MSSCITGAGGGRTYRLDLDIALKSPSSSSSSYPSSTLSESSDSPPLFISTKRARTPRKRPNQCSAEAAALLSTIYPKLFSASDLRRQTSLWRHLTDDPFPVLLPSFSVSDDTGILLCQLPSLEKPAVRLEPKPAKTYEAPFCSTPDVQFQDPGSLDFDAESILDEEIEEGIDSIMGNLSMRNEDVPNSNPNSDFNPYLAHMMRFGLSGISSNIMRAFRKTDEGEWWRSPTVAVKDFALKFKAPPENTTVADRKKKKEKKKKKKVKKDEGKETENNTILASSDASTLEGTNLKLPLCLKLNYDDVLREWSGGSPFSGEMASPNSAAADVISKLEEAELLLEGGCGGVRDASVLRYKEKRRSRLFSKRIRYEVRKVNADRRPRMKGRFVKTQEAMEEESEELAHNLISF
ncbi:Protein chloroplast import apparatus 2 [Apostasia shenzhenica]|uniref:Protein chloroplast import apparatus 2 n=1 Tax=Apostasia shenzhenica TaxID=1088818 RepID=A0A2I0BDD5_9ASPA|nr:Protein chloroplast import apparatus 2 [Apostasia shenzhenica]